MTEPQRPAGMTPPPNLFTTRPPGMDPAVGSTFLPAPGVDGVYSTPGAYSLPAEPARPPGLWAAALLLLGGGGLLILLGLSAYDLSGLALALFLALGAGAIGTAAWLIAKPGDNSRLAATIAACGCALSGLGLATTILVLALLWGSTSLQNYFRQLAQFRAQR